MRKSASILIIAFFMATFDAAAVRCTGAADCHACTTCKSCAHCAKNGGTCGVCKPALKAGQINDSASAASTNGPAPSEDSEPPPAPSSEQKEVPLWVIYGWVVAGTLGVMVCWQIYETRKRNKKS